MATRTTSRISVSLAALGCILAGCGGDDQSAQTAQSSGESSDEGGDEETPTDGSTGAMASTDSGSMDSTDTSAGDSGTGSDESTSGGPDEEATLCVAVRGNGPRIFSHFGAMARIAESFGPIDAAAGGSSASITIFLTESIQMHPATATCQGRRCDDAERGDRIGFLFKSLRGYLEVLQQSEEGTALLQLAAVAGRIDELDIASLTDDLGNLLVEVGIAQEALVALLASPELAELVNPEVVELVAAPLQDLSPEELAIRTFHIADIAYSLRGLGSFSVSGPEMLVRPGLIHFPALAEDIGRMASFYAGYGLTDEERAAMTALLDECAEPGHGLAWAEVAALPLSSGDTTCGQAFAALATAYRETFDERSIPSRAEDLVGADLPALVSTSVMQGEALTTFANARATYLAGSHAYPWDISFEDVSFGYFGAPEDLGAVEENPRGYDDLKTEKFLALGQPSWTEALSLSPAEPGLARALEFGDDLLSAGGWSDLFPVQVLRNHGCDRVLYVTGQGAEHGFQTGVATLLGMQPADEMQLYDLSAPTSSFTQALALADGVWCSDWNAPAVTDVDGIMLDGYNAPLERRDAADRWFDAYAGTVDRADRPGCTPGVSGER